MIKNVNQISEQAFLLDFGDEVTREINQNVINTFNFIATKIQKNNTLGLKNNVTSYNKMLIHFNHSQKNKNELITYLNVMRHKTTKNSVKIH